MTASLLDRLLDRTVIAGYTNVGYRARRRGWHASDLERMDGKVVLITGATSGLGFAAADGFAKLGASVWLIARSEQRGEEARARIVERSGSTNVRLGLCDLSHLRSVSEFAAGFRDQAAHLDVLVNNAGVLTEERAVSKDGIELTLATNVIGPFLLTSLLIPLLKDNSAPGRIINVSSGGMYTQKASIEDLQSERGDFDGPKAYARSKRAQVILTEVWAERLAGSGLVVHAMHPGWVDTPGLQSSLPRFYKVTRPLLRSPEQGADTILWLGAAAEPGRSSGRFWHDRRQRPTHVLPWTAETPQERERLFAECVRLSGSEGATPGPLASSRGAGGT